MMNLWAFFGIIYLGILTYQDYKRNMFVDAKFNYIMVGLTAGLLMVYHTSIWIMLGLIIFIFWLKFMNKKRGYFGEEDINSVSWIAFGFGTINIVAFVTFMFVFLFVKVVYLLLARKLFKFKGDIPFYAVIFVSFVVTCLLQKLLF